MIKRIKAFIEENRLLTYGDTVIVALSGGADSVTLLHVLFSLKKEYDIKLQAAHLNHGIRGEEAERDETFVRALCDSLQIPLHVRREDIPRLARERGKSEELCGREARYAFFEELSAEYGAKIATAHNRDDLAETVLWNLVRGSGLCGLGGIPAKRGSIIRPLLCCTRAQIEAYCAENNLRYVTDSTNLAPLYTRNKIRLQIMPLLKQLNPAADSNIARMAELARDADDYLRNISTEELNNCKTAFGYACVKLIALDKTVLRYALKQLCDEAGAPVDHQHIELMTDALRENGSVDLGGGYRAVCAQGILRITDGQAAQEDDFCVPFDEVSADRLTIERLPVSSITAAHGKIHKKFLNDCIPCDIITVDTVVRYRRAGDTFTDARRGVTKTVKKLLNELKIPREQRDAILLVARGSEVLWMQGVGVSAQAQVDTDRHREVYYLSNPA